MDTPEPNGNFFAQLQRRFDAYADRPLLVADSEKVWRYIDVDTESARLARFLTERGARPGERLSAQVEKSPQALCLYLACLRAGLVFHPLNPAYRRSELEFFLNDATPRVVVCDPQREVEVRELLAPDAIEVLTLDSAGNGSLSDGSRATPGEFAVVERTGSEPAAMLYSSGTTGLPKGIVLSHGNLIANAEALTATWGFRAEDRLLHALSIFHVHGLFIAMGCVLMSGASVRWLPRFDVDRVIEHLSEATVMMGVPTYYQRLLASPRFTRERCASVRVFISGSAPLPESVFARFERRTGHRIVERYGMTETNIIASNPLEGPRKSGAVGPPLPGVELRVVDVNDKPLATNEVGRIQVRGPNVFAAYWRRAADGEDAFTADGYFNTGDLGLLGEDGYLSIVGRSKDLIISGGMNVYPKEIESVIEQLPGIEASAIIGVHHADFGEAVVAVIVPAAGASLDESTIHAALKAKLADFKRPKRIVFAAELPLNAMGKVQKQQLRERYAKLLA